VQRPHTVDELARAVGHSAANTSHHLHALARAHLVRGHREGQFVRYAVTGPEVGQLLGSLHRAATRHVAELEQAVAQLHTAEPVDAATLRQLLHDDAVTLIDVRPAEEFAAGHLPSARSVPLEQLDEHLARLPRDRPVVAYCRGPFCTFADRAATRLRAAGFEAHTSHVAVHLPPEATP
jgi:rhodanese-related sulfurtransferase